ncbi:MAG TPA: HEAT repeat domain-containing protein [Pirellulales bacterium]|nr:HEAT repeat domain-containing protein [Pirellulales bacterium]
MNDDEFAESWGLGRAVRACFWLAILAAAVWWFVSRERPVSARQQLSIMRDSTRAESVRHIAADRLQHADVAIVSDLIQTLREGDALGRKLAALALGRLGQQADAAAGVLIQATQDPNASVREQAIVALGRMSKARELVQLLADDDSDVRRHAVIELGRMRFNTHPFVAALRKTLTDSDACVRAEAYAACWRLSAVSAADLTAAVTGDPDRNVRRTAVVLLGQQPDLTPQTLLPALEDVDSLVRGAALDEIGDMGAAAEPVVAAIAGLLGSNDEKTVLGAAIALGKIGPAASGAIEALIEWSDFRRHRVAAEACAALRQIGREAKLSPPRLFDALHADGDRAQSLVLSDRTSRPAPGVLTRTTAEPGAYAVADADIQHVKKLRHLRFLSLADNPLGDAALAELADLKELRRLDLGHTRISSDGLRHLAGLVNLRTLRLSYCAVNDEGMAQLAQLRSLEELCLDNTLVTDAGVPHLANLNRLKWVTIEGTKITDAGLRHLRGLESLEEVSFSPAQVSLACLTQFPRLLRIMETPASVTDADLKSLAGLKRLKTLTLSHVSITDNGMASIGALTWLESLFLNDLPISDVGLRRLSSLTSLRLLSLRRIRVSQQAVEALKNSLPELTIRPGPTSLGYEVVGLKAVAR